MINKPIYMRNKNLFTEKNQDKSKEMINLQNRGHVSFICGKCVNFEKRKMYSLGESRQRL